MKGRTMAGLLLVVTALSLAGCVGRPRPRPVDLQRVVPADAVRPDDAIDKNPPLRLALAPLLSPAETARSYAPFYTYLQQQLQRRVNLTQQRTYAETYELLRSGSVDIALVCTYVYVLGKSRFGLELVAAPEVDGRPEYFSEIIVRADSDIQTVTDLAGRSFAFTDPLSNSGRAYPLAMLRSRGLDPGTFFSRTTFTYSHDRSVVAVADGLVDGAAVDNLVLAGWRSRHPGRADQLRVIHRSPAFASTPVVASPALPKAVREQVQRVLLEMHTNPAGREVLASLGVDRFVAISDQAFASARAVAAQAGMPP